jgi:hypothetical protein
MVVEEKLWNELYQIFEGTRVNLVGEKYYTPCSGLVFDFNGSLVSFKIWIRFGLDLDLELKLELFILSSFI